MDRKETIDLCKMDEGQTERLEKKLVEGRPDDETPTWQDPFRAQGGKHSFS